MLSVKEAQALIASHVPAPEAEELRLSSALGRIAACEVISPVDLPVFDNSAMDGFALNAAATAGATKEKPILFSIHGAVRAGDTRIQVVKPLSTCRIMTGAHMPAGADTVLPKEKAFFKEDLLAISSPLAPGQNVRQRGEEIRQGMFVLSKGSVINPGTVGFLAGLGIEYVCVYRAPRVAILTTGSELVPPGRSLRSGQIYDSNTSMVNAALEDMRLRSVKTCRIADRPEAIRKAIAASLETCDIVIVMGGVSVGDFDHGKQALADCGVETVFWKVRQKPGKPLYFGKKGDQLVFGLPGNPASVFTCFYEYVYPAIRQMMGHSQPYLSVEKMPIGVPLTPDGEKTLFIKAKVDRSHKKCVMPMKHQQSHMLSAFCEADGLLVVPSSARALEKGDVVEMHALPYAESQEAFR